MANVPSVRPGRPRVITQGSKLALIVTTCSGTSASTSPAPLRSAADAVAVGPGLGRSDAVIRLVAHLWRHLPQPAVFDADALWALAHVDGQMDGQTESGPLAAHAGPRRRTPHAGDLLRLIGADPSSAAAGDRAMLEAQAATLAATLGAVIVLKGPATLITDGGRRSHNDTGNPGMATAGTGDVLGNHDRQIGRLPDTLGLDACVASLDEPPFRFVHEPATDLGATDRGLFAVAGHLHPTVAIRSPSGDRLADRCFVAEPALLVLPAFGSFTGGHRIAP
ncbi:MAG: NAD(P)H-hydrate dehydratase, partial [Planctomycetia bacterium]